MTDIGLTWSLPLPSPCLPSVVDGPPTPKFNVCCALPGPPNGASSLGTMSIKKSNWSDLDRAFEMSERESVRRLFESAIMNARAVISDIKTNHRDQMRSKTNKRDDTDFHKPCKRGWVLDTDNVVNQWKSQLNVKHLYRPQQSSTTTNHYHGTSKSRVFGSD